MGLLLPEIALATTAADVGGCEGTVPSRVLNGNPGNYRTLLAGLGPGDMLQLEAGIYFGAGASFCVSAAGCAAS